MFVSRTDAFLQAGKGIKLVSYSIKIHFFIHNFNQLTNDL